jgi:hypothetical protein
VAYAKRIKRTFTALGKTRQTVELAHRRHAVAATRKHFMGVRLMTDIPYDAVVGRVEDMVQSDSELNHPQARTKMASRACYRVEQIVPQFVRQADKIVALELP